MKSKMSFVFLVTLAACGEGEGPDQAIVQGLQLGPANATGADPLSCTWAETENSASASIRWKVNGATVLDETGEVLDPQWTSKGDKVSCFVTPGFLGATAEQSNVLTIRNAPPVVLTAELFPEFPTERDLLKVESTAEDMDRGDENKLFMHYKWLVNGEEVAYDEHVLGASWWKEGDNISVYVSVGDGMDRSPAQLLGPVTVSNSIPGPPVVEIMETEDGSLTCVLVEPAEELDEKDTLTYASVWREFGNRIQEGGDSLSAELVREGADYSCEMWASDEEGPGESHRAFFLAEGDVIRYQWSFNDAGAAAGTNVLPLSDVDGDGLPDLLVSTPGVTGQKVEMGGVAILGSASLGSDPDLGEASVVSKIWGNQAQAFLGKSIGTTPDFDGDGLDDILLSSAVYTVFSEEVGLALAVGSTQYLDTPLFHFNAEGPNLPAVGIARGGSPGEGFGRSVLGMDLNEDGMGDMFVGVHTDTVSSPGFVRVYSGEYLAVGGPLYMEHALANIQGIPGAFASTMATLPDVDGDGLAELVFSTPALNNGDGAVLILNSSDIFVVSGMEPVQDTAASDLSLRLDGSSLEGFGGAIAGGDWNGDGMVLVGANNATDGDGAAYLLDPSLENPFFEAVVFVGDEGSGFGSSVAFVGDTDGDGEEEIAIGAPFHSESFKNAGVVALYSLAELNPGSTYDVTQAIRIINGEDKHQESGQSVLGPGDISGDGLDDLVIGATGLSAPDGWNEGGLFIWLQP